MKKKLKSDLYNRGFTLIELLIVISLIGLMSSVVFASTDSARGKARDARRVADFRSISIALELYYDKYGVYPCGMYRNPSLVQSDLDYYHDGYPAEHFLNSDASGPGVYNCPNPSRGLFTEGLIGGYIRDPSYDSSGAHPYAYDVSDDRQKYVLYTIFESGGYIPKMSNDGGMLDCFYETGPGVGQWTLFWLCPS